MGFVCKEIIISYNDRWSRACGVLLDLLGKTKVSQYLKDFTDYKLRSFLELVIATPAAVCKLMALDQNAAKKLV